MLLFLLFIFYENVKDETAHIRNNIFLEMKSYSLGFEDAKFSTKEIEKTKKQVFYVLYEDEKGLYILTPLPNVEKKETMMIIGPSGPIMVPYSSDDSRALKVWYSKIDYAKRVREMQYALLWQFVLFAFVALLVSLLAAWYTLYPLRSSLRLLEDFIKDIIHDLNTPLSAIMLNLKMIEKKDDEVKSIQTAAQTIEMLHHNLDAYLREQKQSEEIFDLKEVVDRYVGFFTPLYDDLRWDVHLGKLELKTDKQAFERIIYNLLSNACKYNTSDGNVKIFLKGTLLTIRNNSYGVNHPERVFERFYKESERGLGIGLHIVDKLCQTLKIDKKFMLEGTEVIVELECENLLK